MSCHDEDIHVLSIAFASVSSIGHLSVTMRDSHHTGDVYDPSCSARDVIGLVGSKWVLLIMPALARHPMRTLQLRRAIPGISMKVLMQSLRSLERAGLIARTEHRSARRHVEYTLTQLGESLCTTMVVMDRWAEQNFRTIDAASADYDRKHLARSPLSQRRRSLKPESTS